MIIALQDHYPFHGLSFQKYRYAIQLFLLFMGLSNKKFGLYETWKARLSCLLSVCEVLVSHDACVSV